MKKIVILVIALLLCLGVALGTLFTATDSEQEDDVQNETEVEIESGKLADAHQAVVDYFGETYVATGDVPAEYLESQFSLDMSLAVDYIAQMPMISVQNDLFIGIEVSEGNLDAVVASLTAYRESLVADMLQYPENMIKSNASRVVVIGDYAFLLVLGNIDSTLTDEEAQLNDLIAQMDEVEAAIEAALTA